MANQKFNFRNVLNLFQQYDKGKESFSSFLDRSKQKQPLSNVTLLETTPHFDGVYFDHLLFKHRDETGVKIRVLRLFRVTGVSNTIRNVSSNEDAFKNILINFSSDDISFVTCYGYKPGENVLIAYGILAEGREGDYEKLLKKTASHLNVLKRKFRSVYTNLQAGSFTLDEEWLFRCFQHRYSSVIRGIPKPDPSLGISVGTTPYGSPRAVTSQVSEIVLRGLTSNVEDMRSDHRESTTGGEVLLYAIFDHIKQENVYNLLSHIQDTVTALDSSQEIMMGESENFSIPIMAGFGFGAMTGHASGVTDTQGLSHGVADSTNVSDTESATETTGTGTSLGENATKGKTDGNGGNVGISLGINDGVSWQKAATESHGITETLSEQQSQANGNSHMVGAGHTVNSATNESHAANKSNSSSESDSLSLASGMSLGDSFNTSRSQRDHYIKTALRASEKYKRRVESGLVEGMFEYRFFILSNDEETKLTVEELVKSAYTNNESPLPIRVIDVPNEDKDQIGKYARGMIKPTKIETRPAIPDPHHYTTCVTISEASAFNLPQENLPGYLSSIDPVPPSIRFHGKMKDGARLGLQINPFLNVLSSHAYNLHFEQLGHIGFFGGTGQGKTVAVQQFVKSVHEQFKMNVVLFDFTKNHRVILSHLQNRAKFRYNSFRPDYYPLRINLLTPPPGVPPYIWFPALAEILCYSMCLGDRSFRIIKKVMKSAYEKATRLGKVATMKDFVQEIDHEIQRRHAAYGEQDPPMRMPFNELETFSSMKERLSEWIDEDHPVYHAMCKEDHSNPFMSISDMINGNFVHLIECSHLPAEVQQFVINGITAAIFHYCESREFKLPIPTYLIFEEAHAVLSNTTTEAPLKVNETIFEKINRLARNYNLYIGYVCQSPEKLPQLIFDNMPLRMVFQLPDKEGKEKIVSASGRDPQRLDVDLVKYISRLPQGVCLLRTSRFQDMSDGEFTAIKIDLLSSDELGDSIFRELYRKAKGYVKK